MVPQQGLDAGRSDSPTSSGLPLFGSQLIDKNSSTPYSDATQVGLKKLFFLILSCDNGDLIIIIPSYKNKC